MENVEIESSAVETRFRELLDAFLFFHLGSDTSLKLENRRAELLIEIAHARVETMRFELSESRIRELLKRETAFEDFMLDQLTRHRRHKTG